MKYIKKFIDDTDNNKKVFLRHLINLFLNKIIFFKKGKIKSNL